MTQSATALTTALLLLGTVSGCTDMDRADGATTASVGLMTFSEAFDVVSTISLEENDSIINVTPVVTPDASGRFVIADAGENQIRIYNQSGQLVEAIGQKGQGPVEFLSLRAALSLPNGRLLAFERSGRVHLLNPRTNQSIATAQLAVSPLYGAEVIDDTTILVLGYFADSARAGPARLIGLLDPENLQVEKTFFPVPVGEEWATEARHFGHAMGAVSGDTIAALFSLTDSLYFFGLDGTLIESREINSEQFRPMVSHVPVGSSSRELGEWLSSFSMFYQMHWQGDKMFMQFTDGVGPNRVFRLVAVDRTGSRLFEVNQTPPLVSGYGRSLFFVHPDSIVPNTWVQVN